MTNPRTLLVTAAVHFDLKARNADEAHEIAEGILAQEIEESPLIGAGALSTVRPVAATAEGGEYDATAIVLFRVTADDPSADAGVAETAQAMLLDAVSRSAILTGGGVALVEDDEGTETR